LFSKGSSARVLGAVWGDDRGGEDRAAVVDAYAGDREAPWDGVSAHPSAVKRKRVEAMAANNR